MANRERRMEVWRLGRKLTKLVYQHSKKFPDEEKFGLSSQIRRAAVSIPSNVAEGWGRHYRAEFIPFLRRANGSLVEVETQLMLSADLELSTPQEVDGLPKQTQILGKKSLNLERRAWSDTRAGRAAPGGGAHPDTAAERAEALPPSPLPSRQGGMGGG